MEGLFVKIKIGIIVTQGQRNREIKNKFKANALLNYFPVKFQRIIKTKLLY